MKNLNIILLSVLFGLLFCGCKKDDNVLKGTIWIYTINFGTYLQEEIYEFKSTTYIFTIHKKKEQEDGSIEVETSVSTGDYIVDGLGIYLESGTPYGGIHAAISETGDSFFIPTIITIKEYVKQ